MGKATILIIDDEPSFLSLLKQQLEFEDYDVIAASDGEEGMTKAREGRPDLIICDMKMPKKTGLEVLNELRKDKELALTPFIMLTALDDFETVKKAYDDQADYYATKDIDFSKLVRNIPVLLSLSKRKT